MTYTLYFFRCSLDSYDQPVPEHAPARLAEVEHRLTRPPAALVPVKSLAVDEEPVTPSTVPAALEVEFSPAPAEELAACAPCVMLGISSPAATIALSTAIIPIVFLYMVLVSCKYPI
jgi:hypothetical protein